MLSTRPTAQFGLGVLLALLLANAAASAQDTTSTATPPAAPEREVQHPTRGTVHRGELWPEDPSRTRLFFAQTGRTLRAREAFVAVAYGIVPSVQVGLTDYLTVGAGEAIIGREINGDIAYLTSKLRLLSTPTFSLSAGGVAGVARNPTNSPSIRALYGAGTYGTPDVNVTLGGGWGYGSSVMDRPSVVIVGATARVARDMAFVTENYIAASGGAGQLLSGGVRMMSEHIAVDLAVFTNASADTPLPYVSILYKF